MMTNLKAVQAAATKLGAVIEDQKTGEHHTCEALAPRRHLWIATGNHCLVDSCYQPWKPDYADLLARMSYGIEPCINPECDWCNESDDA